MYIFVGVLLGSLVTSTHNDKEACLGRQATLLEKGVIGSCMPAPNQGVTSTGSVLMYRGNGIPEIMR